MPRRILITGGKGYIGQYLARYFSGEDVFITTRRPRGEKERRMVLEEEESIVGVCRGMDIVIHTASIDERHITQDPQKALLVNTYGTRQLYLDAAACGVKKFLYLSTFHVYGRTTDTIITEETLTRPVSDYGLTHLFAEQYLRQLYPDNRMETAVLRLTNGIGRPDQGVDKWYLVFNDFCRTAAKEKRIVLKSNGLARRDFIAIPDICSAVGILTDANLPDFGIYNVSSQRTASIREIAKLVGSIYKELTGCELELTLPDVTEEEIRRVKDFTVASQKLRTMGWQPRESIEAVIKNILTNELGKDI